MKSSAAVLLSIAGLFVLLQSPIVAQQQPEESKLFLKRPMVSSEAVQSTPARSQAYRIPGKKVSQYTAEDWGAWIDSTWGPGQGAATQTGIFDKFCGAVTSYWAGFPNLGLNWDSLRTTLRAQIATGLSRGRFYALMSRVWLALREYHTGINDKRIDEPLLAQYVPGVPILSIGNYWWDGIGAPVTPQSDSTLFVYRAAPGNPLGLEPGDVLLGYEGVPWKKLYRSLLDAGVPVQRTYATGGSTPEAMTHVFLNTAGWNWGMFDTIDVVKYASGDTLHLATELLLGFNLGGSVVASDQVPVPGVPLPYEPVSSRAVSWGIVQGTRIGYVYVWDWATTSTQQLFQHAIDNLLHQEMVEGLVIDFRTNWGGSADFANGGLSQLFNFDPTSHLWLASRDNPSNAFSFQMGRYQSWSFAPSPFGFDRPIAVLIGPGCWSSGDFNAYRLKKHPMSRLFGKPTNGAFVYGNYASATFSDSWEYSFPTSVVYSDLPGEGYLIHKAVQPDEEVWLTRDGVAKGEDDVVKRAINWINTLTYAHDVQLNRHSVDTVLVVARVQNPLAHAVAVNAILRDGNRSIAR